MGAIWWNPATWEMRDTGLGLAGVADLATRYSPAGVLYESWTGDAPTHIAARVAAYQDGVDPELYVSADAGGAVVDSAVEETRDDVKEQAGFLGLVLGVAAIVIAGMLLTLQFGRR
ncbi:MAG: hypothetical protein ABII76_25450 [Pseudomonadota bacterium]